MKAIILAAGFATRLYPLTKNQAKPLLEVGGKPMLTRLVEKIGILKEIDEILVVGNEKFREQFAAWGKSVASRVPIRVLNDGSTDDDNKLGAIGDLAYAMNQIPGECDLLVVGGDNLFEFDLVPYAAEFMRHRCPLLLLRETERSEGQSRYNEVTTDGQGRVTRFREKPADPQTNLMAICLYFFTPEIKVKVALYLAQGNNPDAPGYFIEWLVNESKVRGVKFSGGWFDIGNLQTLEEARARFAQA